MPGMFVVRTMATCHIFRLSFIHILMQIVIIVRGGRFLDIWEGDLRNQTSATDRLLPPKMFLLCIKHYILLFYINWLLYKYGFKKLGQIAFMFLGIEAVNIMVITFRLSRDTLSPLIHCSI